MAGIWDNLAILRCGQKETNGIGPCPFLSKDLLELGLGRQYKGWRHLHLVGFSLLKQTYLETPSIFRYSQRCVSWAVLFLVMFTVSLTRNTTLGECGWAMSNSGKRCVQCTMWSSGLGEWPAGTSAFSKPSHATYGRQRGQQSLLLIYKGKRKPTKREKVRGPDAQMDSKHAAALWLCLSHQRTLRSIDFSWLIKSDRSCVILELFFVFSHLPSTGSCSLMLPVSKKAAYERARRGTCQCGSREMEWEWFLPCGSTLAKQSLNQTPPTLETYPMS